MKTHRCCPSQGTQHQAYSRRRPWAHPQLEERTPHPRALHARGRGYLDALPTLRGGALVAQLGQGSGDALVHGGPGGLAACGRAGRDPPPRDGSGHKKKKNVRIKESTVPSSGSRDSQLQASMGRPSSRAPITPHSSSPRSPLLLTPSHCSGAAGQGRPPPRHRHCEIQVLPPRSAPVLGNFCFHLGQVVLHGDQNSAGAELEIQHFPLLAAVK